MARPRSRYIRDLKNPWSTSHLPDRHLTWFSEVVEQWDSKKRADAGIVGAPFDGAVITGKQGTRYGPRGVRTELYGSFTTYNLELDVDLARLKLVDCGDIDTDIMNAKETYRRVRRAIKYILDHRILPILVGGDHSLTSPSIGALCDSMGRGKKVGVIDFDAHFDCRSEMSGPQSGYWTREILEFPGKPISGNNIAQIGVHGFRYSPFYRDYMKAKGIKTYTPDDVRKNGMDEIVTEALEIASDGTDAIYATVDIDVLDIAFAPGCAASYPGGLSTFELTDGLTAVGKHSLVKALDLMEIAPPLDMNQMTSKVGAELIMKFLCGLALRKTS